MNLKKEVYNITDEEILSSDIWDISKLRIYAILTSEEKSKIRSKIIDFSIIKNNEIKEELKSYLSNIILNKKRSLITFSKQYYLFNKIILFINTLNRSGSILQYTYNNLYEMFKSYLKSIKFTTTVKIYHLSNNQRKITYIEDNSNINEIKNWYIFIQSNNNKTWNSDNDIWDIRKLNFDIEKNDSRHRYIINFSSIKQRSIKEIMKKYILIRLKLKKFSTVLDDMKALKIFSNYLYEQYPNILNISEIDSDIIKNYFRYIESLSYACTSKRQRKNLIRIFFEYVYYMNLSNINDPQNIFPKSLPKKVNNLPKIIPNEVLIQLNKHLPKLPKSIQNIVIILKTIGMRINELCKLDINCLKKDSEGFYFLEYYQSKTNNFNRIPISIELGKIILKQRDYTLTKYPNTKYLFSIDKDVPICQETVSFHLNKLAYDNKIIDNNGKIFRFKCHHFRHTVATQYANEGMSPNMIKSMLGHKSIKSIMSYIELNSIMQNEKMKDFLDKENKVINSLKHKELNEASIIHEKYPLINGYCDDICDSAFICYSCSMFLLDELDKNLLVDYLKKINLQIDLVEKRGYIRQIEILTKTKRILEKKLNESGEIIEKN